MKFFHLSDLHIGVKLGEVSLIEDQREVFDQICTYAKAEKPQAIVIAGDIYDKKDPSPEAVALFDEFITRLYNEVPDAELMLISGNHDSGPRVNVFRSVLRRQKIHMIGMPPVNADETIEKVTLTDEFGPVHFYLLPFVRPSMVRMITGSDENGNALSYDAAVRRMIGREAIDREERNVLVSHQFYLPAGVDASQVERMDSEIRTVGNIDEVRADVLDPFDYAALGHIHKPMKVGADRFRYCGTPLACSVSEAEQPKGVIMVDMAQKGEITTTVLPLKPLRSVRVIRGTLEEVLKETCADYVSVRLTDKVDLDVLDMQERLREAFPGLLEIRREVVRAADYSAEAGEGREEAPDPFDLCCDFLPDLTEEEKKILQDVINQVQEVQA